MVGLRPVSGNTSVIAGPEISSRIESGYQKSVAWVMAWVWVVALTVTGIATAQVQDLKLVVSKQLDEPILTVASPGAEGNKYGFEGGRVLKLDGKYHLFTSEMIGDPHWVKMRLAHWTSRDRLNWKRESTLFESSGDFTGKDPRAALWSPMPIYDETEGLWNLFYVAYQCAPDTAKEWLTNHEGRIWRAVSKVKGRGGIGGPYKDVGIVLQRDKDSDPWEGLQGTDSFFPYRAGNRWYAFYGTGHTETLPIQLWQVGLAWAPRLGGPWKRCSELNPLNIQKPFIENPVVTKLTDGTYTVIYDNHVEHSVGYSFSNDGIHWAPGKVLTVQTAKGAWASEVRTPLGLIPEGNDSFTLFYTANEKQLGASNATNWVKTTPGALGFVEVKPERLNEQSSSTILTAPFCFAIGRR